MNNSQNHKQTLLLTRRHILGLGGLAALTCLLPAQVLAAEKTDKKNLVAPARKPRPPHLVMLDPGHGGKDPGASGHRGTLEKDVTLDVARRIAARFDGNPNIIAKLTRDSDIFLPLKERVARAREAKADLFISVHADSTPTTEARGLSAYSLSEKGTDNFARELAKRENSVDELAGIDLKDTDADVAAILRDLTARHTMNAALKAKKQIVRGIKGKWQLLDNPLRAAPFAVLRAPDIPSILIETGFLSNPKDEALLRNEAQRGKIAGLLAKEIAALLQAPPFA